MIANTSMNRLTFKVYVGTKLTTVSRSVAAMRCRIDFCPRRMIVSLLGGGLGSVITFTSGKNDFIQRGIIQIILSIDVTLVRPQVSLLRS